MINTQLYGLIGKPVEHSLSPAIHNALFKKHKINAVYLPFEVDDLESAVKGGARALGGIQGLNVTMPYKERILEFLDGISDDAKVIGSVNTIVNREGGSSLDTTQMASGGIKSPKALCGN